MKLIRRRDQVRDAAARWLAEWEERASTVAEDALEAALERRPEVDDVTEAMLAKVGRPLPPLVCADCAAPIRDGQEFGANGAVICLHCLTRATTELSRL